MNRVDSLLGREDWVGKLTLNYYEGPGDPRTRTIPFYENPTIVESQNPRYMNYAVVGRSSNLFGYLGADSRKFNLSFNINLPHIAAHMSVNAPFGNTPPTKVQKMTEILQSSPEGDLMSGGVPFGEGDLLMEQMGKDALKESTTYQGVAAEFDEEFYGLIEGTRDGNIQAGINRDSPMYKLSGDAADLRRKSLNYIASLIASIRSTVINNTIQPEFGPPMVRLDWGILYRDVPCICKGYTLNVNGKSGYDKKTLLPRVIEVTMNLEEARALNTAEVVEDTIVGWEVLLGTETKPGLTMDPGNFKSYQVTYEDV
jgi:hypothetical protein